MDFDSIPTEGQAPNQAAPQAPPSFDAIPDQNQQAPSDLGETIKAGVMGVRKGLLGPLAELQNKYMPSPDMGDTQSQQLESLAEKHPVASGVGEAAGLIGGAMLGTGQAGLASKAAETVLPAAGKSLAAQIGSGALKGFIENSLLQGGDEISKAMLGQGDPATPVSSALAHMGAAGLFGSVMGGAFGGASAKLKALGDAQVGTKAAQAVEDFGKRWEYNLQNPNVNDAVTKELGEFYNSTNQAVDEVRGATGLKSQAIDKLSQDIKPEQLTGHIDQVGRMIENAPAAIKNEPAFQEAVNSWKAKTTPQIDPITMQPSFTPDAGDVFKSTDNLKRQLQEWAKPLYEGRDIPISERPFINSAASMATGLKGTLENSSHWGDLGDLQKTVNKATSDFIPALKDFNRRFTKRVLGESTLDPGPINTYVNQLGKPNAEIKQAVMENFVGAAEKYRDQINTVHQALGVEPPLPPSSLNAVKGTYGEVTPGAKLADYLHNQGVAGALEHERIPKYIATMLGKPVDFLSKKYAVPGAIKMLSSGAANRVAEGLDYANNVNRGAQKVNTAMKNLFQLGGKQAIELEMNERDRERVKKYIKNGGINSQIQQQAIKEQKTQQKQQQHFAEGGEVLPEKTMPTLPDSLFQGSKGMSEGFPTHNVIMQTARGRISQYLNSIRPDENPPKLPFDHAPPMDEKNREYDKAIDLANQPLSILNHVKGGSLTPQLMKHFTQMYPELYGHLSQHITGKLSEHQLEEQRPDYKLRQSLSLFLGAPLDSTMTPQAIQSIQSVFANKKPQQQAPQPQGKKGSPSKIGKMATEMQTPDQARTSRVAKG